MATVWASTTAPRLRPRPPPANLAATFMAPPVPRSPRTRSPQISPGTSSASRPASAPTSQRVRGPRPPPQISPHPTPSALPYTHAISLDSFRKSNLCTPPSREPSLTSFRRSNFCLPPPGEPYLPTSRSSRRRGQGKGTMIPWLATISGTAMEVAAATAWNL
jgi:hypothetical protein